MYYAKEIAYRINEYRKGKGLGLYVGFSHIPKEGRSESALLEASNEVEYLEDGMVNVDGYAIAYKVIHQKGHHTYQGETIYWDHLNRYVSYIPEVFVEEYQKNSENLSKTGGC